jgi:DNA-binding beta-propeller fold protein YncE
LRELEHKYAREIVVLGVHSGKYIAERVTSRIRDAALRLDNAHPIVNDRQFRVWRSYAVRAWPTLVVVDPAGYAVGMQAGEFTADQLSPFLDALVAGADDAGVLRREPLEFPPDAPTIAPGTLRYPGKVALDPADPRRIAIADSGHHRVLVGTLSDDGRRVRVERQVGGSGDTAGTAAGFEDGTQGRLTSPQGMAFDGGTLYVADAGNHAVRAVELARGAVRTVAGTGKRLRTRADLDAGALASPWDLTLVDGTLYVAMAGTHQLYAIDPASGRSRVHAGSGGEDIRDGRNAEALLAQPMGIAHRGGRLYFADSESSAVRWASIDPAGGVHTLVGTGLFDFGDEDGVADQVRMQHQQGIAVHPSGRLLVADSYNDALKWVDPDTRRAETWLRGFHEPGGLAVGGGRVYVADTNAHRVAVVEESGEVAEVEIEEARSTEY